MSKINDIENLMYRLADSHSNLSQEEYNRNQAINNASPMFVIEGEVIDSWERLFGRTYFDAIKKFGGE